MSALAEKLAEDIPFWESQIRAGDQIITKALAEIEHAKTNNERLQTLIAQAQLFIAKEATGHDR